MRVVVLTSSVYSETACAMCVNLARRDTFQSERLHCATLNRETLLRKVGQWGFSDAAGYARQAYSQQWSVAGKESLLRTIPQKW